MAGLFNRAEAAYRGGQLADADKALGQLLMLMPDLAEAWHLRGLVMYAARQLPQAVTCFERAIGHDAKVPNYHANLALALIGLQQFGPAMASCMAALKRDPRHFGASLNMGLALYEAGRTVDALKAFEQARRIKPQSPLAESNVARAALHLGEYEAAALAYARSRQLQPDNGDYAMGHARALYMQGRTAQSREILDAAARKWPEHVTILGARTFILNYFDDVSATEQAEAARLYGQAVARQATPVQHHADPAQAERKVRLGFVSADLRNHSVGLLLAALLPHLDRERLQLVAYSTAQNADEHTARLRGQFDEWCDGSGLDNGALAKRIQADRIDVLFDLSGHTMGNRLPVFAQRPAPVSATWLGYSGTTGLDSIDYLVCDKWVFPEGDEAQASERAWRLPHAYLAFAASGHQAPPRRAGSGPVFGSFNSHNKISDGTLQAWAEILRALPDSQLLLKSRALGIESERVALGERFEALGIARDRLRLLGRTATQAEHLALYGEIDIALDPFPYNGTTTTVQALGMGVPVLTLRGNRYINRVGASILANAGLEEWIADDVADYVSKAVSRARDNEGLERLRASLPERIAASAVCDVERFGQDFSDMVVSMWRDWCLNTISN